MKAIRKILAVFVCLCVVCSCAVFVVLAAETTGSITIQNPSNSNATVAGKKFDIYKIFDATTNGTNTSYSWYKDDEGNIPFEDFFYDDDNGYMEKAEGTVQEVVEKVALIGIDSSTPNNFELSQFAEKLHVYIKEKGIQPIKTIQADSNATSVNIPDLSYGYYLVYDATELSGENASAVRSAVMLTNVNKDAIITLKANRPQILKQVEENNGTFGKGTSVSIGDTVAFKITTAVPSHTLYTSYQYYIEDIMHDGLELDATSIKVYKNENLLAKDTDYTLTIPGEGEVDFKVDFTSSMNVKDKLAINDTLIIEYEAKVTDRIGNVNQNTAKLTYSNDPTKDASVGSVSDSVSVYSYNFVFTKFAQDTSGVLTNIRLSGAEFELYEVVKKENATVEEILVKFTTRTKTVILDGEEHSITEYVVAEDANAEGTIATLETCNEGESTITLSHLNMGGHKGDVAIFGLAEGTYKLVEKKAPDGYVLPDKPFYIEIVDEIGALGSVGTLNVTGSHEGDIGKIVNTNGMAENILTVWAEITNKPGSALPETGGIGTAIFTILGVVMMAGAATFFTSRKRSSMA